MTRVKVSSSDLFSCSLPCLEELRLHYCYGIKHFNMSSCSMKILEIHNSNNPFKVTVNAPSIVTFRYQDIFPQSISFSPAASSWKSYIDMAYFSDESSLNLNDMIGLLKALSDQSQISIELGERTIGWLQNKLPFMNDVSDLPVVVDHLIVVEPMHASAAGDYLKSLFLVLRPRFIYMRHIKEWTETHRVTEMILKQRDMVPQLFLEGVSMQVLYWNRGKWKPFEPVILSKLISKNGEETMDQTCGPTDLERRIKLVIFDLDRASLCYRKFLRNYLALCY